MRNCIVGWITGSGEYRRATTGEIQHAIDNPRSRYSSPAMLSFLKHEGQAMLKVGDRIKLLAMDDDPHPIPPGATGTIKSTNKLSEFIQYDSNWDSPHDGRSLMVVTPPDVMERL